MATTNENLLPLSGMTNEELLLHVYNSKELRSPLEIELSKRLEAEMDGIAEDTGRDLGTLLEQFDGKNP